MPCTFKVTDKKPELVPVRKPGRYDDPGTKSTNRIAGYVEPNGFSSSKNGFVKTVINAYNGHHNLTIRPDDVWIAIVNVMQMYIVNNAEALRGKFVKHTGKKELVVKGLGDIHTANYEELCYKMSKQIEANIIDKEFASWIQTDFTTSTSTDKLVSIAMLMCSMKKYFDYKFALCCGLPNVTLLGEVSDWEHLIQKADKIPKYDINGQLTKWHVLLMPVLKNMLESVKGNPDLTWWNQVCSHLTGGSGPHYISGWITVFTIFDDSNNWIGDRFRVKQNFSPEFITSKWPIIESNDICSGSCEVPIKIDDNGQAEYKTKLVAGHMGYIAKGTDLAPCLGWELHILEKKDMKDNLDVVESKSTWQGLRRRTDVVSNVHKDVDFNSDVIDVDQDLCTASDAVLTGLDYSELIRPILPDVKKHLPNMVRDDPFLASMVTEVNEWPGSAEPGGKVPMSPGMLAIRAEMEQRKKEMSGSS
jgi:hypothetical protein